MGGGSTDGPVVSVSPRPDSPAAPSAGPATVGPFVIEGHEKATEVNDAEDGATTVNSPENSSVIAAAPQVQTVQADDEGLSPNPSPMVKEPDTRPISQEQLVAEVKGTYAGLVMVESKCIEVDSSQISIPTFNSEQYQALVKLHRTLIQEHYDFFMASQHPKASPELQKLAEKYFMVARMWKHGIHSFLEVLRKRLPGSQEFLEDYIQLAYSMMDLLDESVPQFRNKWVECKGDLARYGWAIFEKANLSQDWNFVSQREYTRVVNDDPTSPPLSDVYFDATVSQLFYHTKSLVINTPFFAARDSLFTVIDPIIARDKEEAGKPASVALNDVRGLY